MLFNGMQIPSYKGNDDGWLEASDKMTADLTIIADASILYEIDTHNYYNVHELLLLPI